MIPSAARAVERLFGSALGPAAGMTRAVAWAALLALAALLAVRGARAMRDGRALAGGAALLLVLGLVAAAAACRIGDASAPPLAALAGAAGFLFFAGAAAAGARAASAAPHGTAARVIAGAVALSLLLPAGAGVALSRALDPPPPQVIGSLWSTPTALYVAGSGRARREAGAAPAVEAQLVTARSRLFGVEWTGLARLTAAGKTFPWRGRGGRVARFFDFVGPGPGRGGGWLSVERSRVAVSAPPNVRVWIFRSASGVSFSPVAGPSAPDEISRVD